MTGDMEDSFKGLMQWLAGIFSADREADKICVTCETFPATRYITNTDGKGWLMVRFVKPLNPAEPTYPPLPQYLKVRLDSEKDGREYFTIVEGKLKDTKASVKLKDDGGSYLSKNEPPHTGPATVVFNRRSEKLHFNGKALIAVTDPANKTPVGSWKLDIPYEIHSLGFGYEAHSIFAATWFRIASESEDGVTDRYLHSGNISAGCTTVKDLAEWTQLYHYLIRSRDGDLHVGTLKVVDE